MTQRDELTPLRDNSVEGMMRDGLITTEMFFANEWPRYRRESDIANRKIDEMHTSIALITTDTKHLHKLEDISQSLKEVNSCLMTVLSGKDIISTETAKEMLTAQQKTYSGIITSLCKIFGLIIVILVGVRILAPDLLK